MLTQTPAHCSWGEAMGLMVRNMGSNKTAGVSVLAPPRTSSAPLGKPLNLSTSFQDLSFLMYKMGIVMVHPPL